MPDWKSKIIFAAIGWLAVSGCSSDSDGSSIYMSDKLTVTMDSVFVNHEAVSGPIAVSDSIVRRMPQITSVSPLVNAAFAAGITPPNEMVVPHHLRHIYIDSFDWLVKEWENYKMNPDSTRLANVYVKAVKALNELRRFNIRKGTNLIQGIPDYTYGISGFCPDWASDTDKFQMLSLGVNVMYVRALGVLRDISAELNVDEDNDYDLIRKGVIRDILNRFWMPNLGCFSALLYGGLYSVQLQMPDNYAQAIAVTEGVVPDDIVRKIPERTPVNVSEVPLSFPGHVQYGKVLQTLSLKVQSAWMEAAARCGNEDALNLALASLLARGEEGSYGVRRGVIRAILGVSTSPQAMHFSPFVPTWCSEGLRLEGLKYKECVLDVNVSGSGGHVGSFAIDGVPQWSQDVDADLKGRHSVTIVMTDEPAASTGINIIDNVSVPSAPVVMWSRSDAIISNFNDDIEYMLYVNGAIIEQFSSPKIELFSPRELTLATIAGVSGERWVGFSSKPYRWGAEPKIIKLDTLLNDSKRQSMVIETEVNSTARYLVECRYLSDDTRLIGLECNGRHAGYFLLPSTQQDSVASLSNPLVVRMDKGINQLTLSLQSGEQMVRVLAVHLTSMQDN